MRGPAPWRQLSIAALSIAAAAALRAAFHPLLGPTLPFLTFLPTRYVPGFQMHVAKPINPTELALVVQSLATRAHAS